MAILLSVTGFDPSRWWQALHEAAVAALTERHGAVVQALTEQHEAAMAAKGAEIEQLKAQLGGGS